MDVRFYFLPKQPFDSEKKKKVTLKFNDIDCFTREEYDFPSNKLAL